MRPAQLLPITVFFILFCGIGYLTFIGLGQNALWDDEAGTALYARNIVKTGSVTGWDGKNIIGYRNAAELDDQFVNSYMPRFQFYITAYSYKIFGESTFTSRFPHALLGFLSLLLLYKYAREFVFKKSYWALLAPLYLGLTPSFYLYIRQCRYYAEVIFFTILVLYLYKKMDQLKWKGRVIFVLSLIGLFTSNYLSFTALMASLGMHLFLVERIGFDKKRWFSVATVLVPAFAIIVYLFICYNPFGQSVVYHETGNWFYRKLTLLYWNLRELNLCEWYPVVLFAAGIYVLYGRYFSKKHIASHLIIAGVYIISITLFSPQPVTITYMADIRYLAGLFPVLAVIAACTLKQLTGKIAIAVPIIFLCGLTNVLTLKPLTQHGFQANLFAYINEIHKDYTTSYEAVISFLTDNALHNEKIFVWPDYMTYPIMFYCPEFIYCGQLSAKTSHFSNETLAKLPDYVFIERAVPDWIIGFGPNVSLLHDYFTFLEKKNVPYQLNTLLPVFWQDQTRPELLQRSFGPIKNFDPDKQGIFIYKRVRNEN